MLELLRKYMDSLVGITEMSRERADALVGDLQERGEVRAKDLQKTAQDLVDRSLRNRRELVRLVQKEIRRQIHALGLATKDDVDRLSTRVKKLEGARKGSSAKTRSSKSSGSKSGSSKGSSASRSSAKKSSAKKSES